jgi:hypothetical protein
VMKRCGNCMEVQMFVCDNSYAGSQSFFGGVS